MRDMGDELYKRVYNNPEVFIEWFKEIQNGGIDEKGRVRNPLSKGSFIYTNKNGLYTNLWHVCLYVFLEPIKRYYRRRNKYYDKPV
jgi:hypothetical protein